MRPPAAVLGTNKKGAHRAPFSIPAGCKDRSGLKAGGRPEADSRRPR